MSNPRFSQRSFNLYSPWIAKMVDSYPQSIMIAPREIDGKSSETVRARLKDAIKSYIDNNWPSPIDEAKWATIPNPRSTLKVFMLEDGCIIAGATKDLAKPAEEPTSVQPPDAIFDCPCAATQSLIVNLCHSGALPQGIKVKGFTDIQTTIFSDTFDVTFKPLTDGVYLLR